MAHALRIRADLTSGHFSEAAMASDASSRQFMRLKIFHEPFGGRMRPIGWVVEMPSTIMEMDMTANQSSRSSKMLQLVAPLVAAGVLAVFSASTATPALAKSETTCVQESRDQRGCIRDAVVKMKLGGKQQTYRGSYKEVMASIQSALSKSKLSKAEHKEVIQTVNNTFDIAARSPTNSAAKTKVKLELSISIEVGK